MINAVNKMEALLIHHEGMRLKPYRCSSGKLTIGVGRNLDDNGISENEAIVLLKVDLCSAMEELGKVFSDDRLLPHARAAAIIDMMFNLGRPRFETFQKMIAAIKAEDFKTAAEEMLDSKWAKQVGKRAETLAEMMRSGEWPEFLTDEAKEKGGAMK